MNPRRLVLAALLATALPRAARAQETLPPEIVLGFNPAENAQTLQRSADELAHALSDRIHVPVRATVTLDYTTLVESMRSGHVHFAWLTPSPLVLAERLFGVHVVLTQVRRGQPTYYSAIVVREDSRFRAIEDLQHGSIAWIDPTSTSGYVIPRYLLLRRGFNPSTFFARQVFAGQHDAAVIAVQRGQIDAAAVWADPPNEHTGAWTRYLAHRPGPRLRALMYSPPVPSDAIATTEVFAREHPLLVRSVSSSLMAIGQSEEGRAILRRLNSTDGFVPSDIRQYDLVRQAFRATRDEQTRARSGRFDDPRSMQIFAALLLGAALLGAGVLSRRPRAQRWAAFGLFGVALFWAAIAARIPMSDFLRGWRDIGQFLRGMFPPDRRVVAEVMEATVLTVRLALVGTVAGIPLALLLGLLSAENVTPSGLIRRAARFACNLNRSIDLLIIGLILVSAYGPGAFPGVGALAIHTVGSLGKQFYETLETMDPGPVEAMRSLGATRLQVLRWGIWPQFTPHFVSQALFRFELNVRGAVVLGLVGAQGIGFLLQTYMRGAEYGKVTVVIAAVVILVMALDAVSSRLRRNPA
ncbi:MAG: phosphonate transporter, periplasmic phosphonate-binding protein [Myxococcaceae bacterium]|nr:phosphonate transporter, periplasmic phosphonate-binding protein [Myxococcaceae bacterium]